MKGKWISVVLAVALIVAAFVALPAPRVLAAGTINYYPTNVAKDAVFSLTSLTSGTPFAVYVTITGAPASTSCTGPKLRLMDSATGTGVDANFRTWTNSTNGWLTDSGAWASFPSITTDASGTWSGWAYGAIPASATNSYLGARIRCGGSNYTTATPYPALTLMDMSTTGGWLEETVGVARAGRAYVVKSSGTIVGMYVSEDNGVAEGYPATAAYSKVAVPTCTACGYTIESWELAAPGTAVGQVNTMGAGSCPNAVTAGGTTSLNACSAPTAVTLRALTARAPLSPLAAIPIAGLALAGGLAAWRRRRA